MERESINNNRRIFMNENIDLVKILKDCPKGTKFYSYIFGEETKHLVGTKEEAPEYYRYWED